MSWSQISTDFDPEEETANFGTRHALEVKGTLFDVVTYATIQRETDADTDPADIIPIIHSRNSDSNVALVLNSCLHVFFTDDVSESIKPRSFDLGIEITAITRTPCLKFVLCLLSSGEIRLLYVLEQKFLPPITLRTEKQREDEGTNLIGIYVIDDRIYVFDDVGNVIIVDNVPFIEIHEAFESKNMKILKTIQEGMKIYQRNLVQTNDSNERFYSIYEIENGESVILQSDKRLVKVTNIIDNVVLKNLRFQHPIKTIKSSVLINKGILFSLEENGSFCVLCAHTFIVLIRWDEEQISDFMLLEDSGDENVKLIFVTKTGPKLQIRDFPTFELTYELNVNPFCVLIDSFPNQESPYILEGNCEMKNVSVLRLRGIVEASPDARLTRLLRRNKFDEARRFAENFKLDIEPIHQAKTQWLLDRLSPWNVTTKDDSIIEEYMSELKTTLRKMTDMDYLAQICTRAVLPTVNHIRSLLIFSREIIRSNLESLSVDFLVLVSQSLQLLETFRLLGGTDVEEWIDFSRTKRIDSILNYLSKNKIKEAKLIWTRHLAEFPCFFDPDVVMEILAEVREEKEDWCRIFIPDALKMNPECLPTIAKWAHDTVRAMEGVAAAKCGWPENGLNFAREILTCMEFEENENTKVQLVLLQQRSDPSSFLSRFVSLIDILEDLFVLHNNFRIKIKLADFFADKIEVAHRILDWTSPEEVSTLMEHYLKDFFRRFRLNTSDVYERYAINLIDNTGSTWHWNIGAAPWEEKVKAVSQYIYSVDAKAAVILKALQSAPVPWSDIISDLCVLGSSLSTPLSVSIREQRTLVSLKQILRLYQCRAYTVNNRIQAERMIKMILKRSRGSYKGYLDAKEVAQVLPYLEERDATLLYIRYLMQRGRDKDDEEEPKEAIAVVDDENRSFLCKRILGYAEILLKEGHETNITELKNCLSFLNSATTNDDDSMKTRLLRLKQRVSLAEEFHITYHHDYGDPITTLNDFISDHVERDSNLKEIYRKIHRLSNLLNVNYENALSLLTAKLIRIGRIQDAIESIRILVDTTSFYNEEPYVSPWKLIVDSCVYLAEETELYQLPDALKSLCSLLLCRTSTPRLMDSCELSTWLRLLVLVDSHRGHGNNEESQRHRPYLRNKFSYRDKGIPLNASAMTPLFETLGILFPQTTPFPPMTYRPLCVIFANQKPSVDYDNDEDETMVSFSRHDHHHHHRDVIDFAKISNSLLTLSKTITNLFHRHAQTLLSFSVFLNFKFCRLMIDSADVRGDIESSEITGILFPKILTERKRELDLSLALSILLSEPTEISLRILSDTHESFPETDYFKRAVLSRVGMYFSKIRGLTGEFDNFKTYYLSLMWAKRATEIGVHPKDALVISEDSKIRILNKLIKSPVSAEELKRFADAFGLDRDDVLVAFAEATLMNGGSVDTTVMESIKSPLAVTDLMNRVWNIASPYDYSVLEFALRSLLSSSSSSCPLPPSVEILMDFLKQYTRCNGPTDAERSLWFDSYTSQKNKNPVKKSPFPEEMAKTRLPFTPLVTSILTKREKFKLLEREFQLSNYQVWVDVSHVLNFQPDNIRVKAIENAVQDLIHDPQNTETTHKRVLEDINRCVTSMTDSFKAMSCAHWVLNKLPLGSDKVEASRECRRFAEKWRQRAQGTDDEDNSIKALEVATEDQLRLETEFALMKRGLLDEFADYIDRVEEGLIMKLYEHESIIRRSKKVSGGYFPDINGAVAEICEIHGLNLTTISCELLDNWLPESKDTAYMDETFIERRNEENGNVSDETDQKNFLRSVYVSETKKEVHRYLLNLALSEGRGNCLSTSHKLRALKCLLSVINESDLKGLTRVSYSELQRLYGDLWFVSKLESLGLHYDLETYKSCDKELLIESVLRSSGSTDQGLSLIVDLCMSFSIYKPSLWEHLLSRIEERAPHKLEPVLLELNHQPHLWHLSSFLSAWNRLLLLPFGRNSDRLKCAKSVQLLKKCPLDLNVQVLKGECIRLHYEDLVQELDAFIITS